MGKLPGWAKTKLAAEDNSAQQVSISVFFLVFGFLFDSLILLLSYSLFLSFFDLVSLFLIVYFLLLIVGCFLGLIVFLTLK